MEAATPKAPDGAGTVHDDAQVQGRACEAWVYGEGWQATVTVGAVQKYRES